MWILTYKTNSTTLDFIKLIVQIWISFGSVFPQEMVTVGDRIEASVHSVHPTALHHFAEQGLFFLCIFLDVLIFKMSEDLQYIWRKMHFQLGVVWMVAWDRVRGGRVSADDVKLQS